MSQKDFRAALLDPDLPVPEGLADPAGGPAGRRFDVYRNNVTVSLTEALGQAFPVVRKLVGPDFFAAMAREHLRAHPPTSPVLMFYGQDMPAFLATFPPVAHLGYLPDMARLELALRQSYHAADVPPAREDDLARLDPDSLMATELGLAPSVRLIRSDWPIYSIWMANMRGTPPPTEARPESVLVLRPGFDPEPFLVSDQAARFLQTLIDGQTIGRAFEASGPFDLSATFALLLANGALAGVRTRIDA